MTPAFLIVFFASSMIGASLTVFVRRAAPRWGWVDRPDGRRKLHGRSIPLGGGLAVLATLIVVLAVLTAMPNPWQEAIRSHRGELLGMLAAAVVIVVVGLVDDRVGLAGRHKLLGQILAIAVLVGNGLVIQRISILGWQWELAGLAVPATCFWLLGAVNSVNLLDGIDGLASTLGIILAVTFAALAAWFGHPEVAIVAMVFAGGLFGFLWFNFPPASIFLGDAGSMLIGLILGALAIQGSIKGPGTVLLAAPLAAWTIPIFDSAAAILRRKLSRRSIYTTDRGHMHHRLLDRLGSNHRVLACLAICSAITSAAALASVIVNNDLVALVVGAVVVAVFVGTNLFGQAEFLLVVARLRRVVHAMAPRGVAGRVAISQSAVRIQGSRPWDHLWLMLTDSAEKLGLSEMHFDVSLPLVHEEFTATWERPSADGNERCWRMEIPLTSGDQPAGRLVLVGTSRCGPACRQIARLLHLLDPLETRLKGIVEGQRSNPL